MLHGFGSSSDTSHLHNKAAREVRRFRDRQTDAVERRIGMFVNLAEDIRGRPGPVRLVGIDGCGGAGKSTFAGRLSRALDNCSIVHTDDFTSHEVPTEWWPRMLRDVVEPLLHGESASYTPYDWESRRPHGQRITIQPTDVVIIEGVGATRAAWRDRLVMRIWIDAPRDLRLARGIERDGEELREFWHQWMAAEDVYVADEQPWAHADLIVDGATPPSDEGEYVELTGLTAPR
jgi:uridine kinase